MSSLSAYISQEQLLAVLPAAWAAQLKAINWDDVCSFRWWLQNLMQTFESNPEHVVVEFSLLVLVLWLLFRTSYDPKKSEKLSAKEEEELIREWKPAPLVPNFEDDHTEEPVVVESVSDAHIIANGKKFANFAANNFLGFANNDEVKVACRKVIDKYGVGSCGPRGFYGTIDIHLNLEKEFANFYGTGQSILYSDAIACIASVIPAFAKRGDLIVCDDGVHYGIKQGIELSRSNVLYFKHNDVNDLERILQDVREKDLVSSKKKLYRRFVIVEGISQNFGDICPLDKVHELCEDYKYRLILDDSLALGVLGKTGKGSPEHFGIKPITIDAICASLDATLATTGGICVGSAQLVDHQRLSGLGYCFSAASPPYTSEAAIIGLKILQREPQRCETLRNKAAKLRKGLKKLDGVKVYGDDLSPVAHLRLQNSLGSREADEVFFRIVEEKLRGESILVHLPRFTAGEHHIPEPSIRISVMVNHTDKDIDHLCNKLADALQFAFSL